MLFEPRAQRSALGDHLLHQRLHPGGGLLVGPVCGVLPAQHLGLCQLLLQAPELLFQREVFLSQLIDQLHQLQALQFSKRLMRVLFHSVIFPCAILFLGVQIMVILVVAILLTLSSIIINPRPALFYTSFTL